ncbi:MAG: hypothetical protein KDA61_13885, partial [Planctomycetales bacterium]|nr:hypothetical protein [Planctomycetales bacterium]
MLKGGGASARLQFSLVSFLLGLPDGAFVGGSRDVFLCGAEAPKFSRQRGASVKTRTVISLDAMRGIDVVHELEIHPTPKNLRHLSTRWSAAIRMLVIWSLLSTVAAPSKCTASDASIAQAGAVGDGQMLCTAAIQRTIDDVASSGGGTVTIPRGTFRTGALFLKQGVHLKFDDGGELLGSTELADYPVEMTRIEGHFEPWIPALINGRDLKGVRISGAGTLNGNGKPFWAAFWKRRAENPKCTNLEVQRPRLMFLQNCNDVVIDGLLFKDSGFWNLHVYKCRDVRIENVTIRAPHGDPPKIIDQSQPWDEISIDRAPSSDGIDVDSCQNV